MLSGLPITLRLRRYGKESCLSVKIKLQRRLDTFWLRYPLGSGAYHRWLVDDGSLTRRLQMVCARFAVRGVRQVMACPLPDEAALLGLRPGQTALIREVWLQDGETPLVFARSVLPRASLRGVWRKLGCLGSRPLGAALFSDHKVFRRPLAFSCSHPQHPVFKHAPQAQWARRSVFMRDGRAILVTEAFLPAILHFPT